MKYYTSLSYPHFPIVSPPLSITLFFLMIFFPAPPHYAASLEEVESKLGAYRAQSKWLHLWLCFLQHRDMADLTLVTHAHLHASQQQQQQAGDVSVSIRERLEGSGVLERPLIAAAVFAFLSSSTNNGESSAAGANGPTQAQLYAMLRAHNAPLFSMFMESVPFLYHSLQSYAILKTHAHTRIMLRHTHTYALACIYATRVRNAHVNKAHICTHLPSECTHMHAYVHDTLKIKGGSLAVSLLTF